MFHIILPFPSGSEQSIFDMRSYVELEFRVELLIEVEVFFYIDIYRTASYLQGVTEEEVEEYGEDEDGAHKVRASL
jgi:hypothetical protein